MATAPTLARPAGRALPTLARGVATLQGLYYLATGVWPLVSMDTFLAVTGPKTDLWLVNTVGLLVGVVGVALLVAAWRGLSPEAGALAVGSLPGPAPVGVGYVGPGGIP